MAPVDVDNNTKNWLKAGLALKHLKDGLLPFVTVQISALHTAIISKCGSCNACTTENVLQCPTRGTCQITGGRCQYHDPTDPWKKPKVCPKYICNNIRKEIIDNHVFSKPIWKNTDATQWSANSWEIAKCYLPPHSTGSSPAESDCTGILNLCLHCTPLEAAFSHVRWLVEQNRDNRNLVMHCAKQELTDTERHQFIQDAINLLRRYKTPVDADTQRCIDILIELDSEGIMLTSDDFAEMIKETVEAVKHDQEKLRTELDDAKRENTTSIASLQSHQESQMKDIRKLDNSLQMINSKLQYVDANCKKELRDKMEEIRRMNESMKLDLSRRIEAVENEMKQIRAVQNKEVLQLKEQASQLAKVELAQKQFASVQKREVVKRKRQGKQIENMRKNRKHLDTQQNTEARQRLRDHLVTVYKKTCTKMLVSPPRRNMMADINDQYFDPEMKQVEMPHEPKTDINQSQNKRHNQPQTDGTGVKLPTVNSYQDLFYRNGKRCQNIYIKGEAGTGKSTFCQNMVYTWSKLNSTDSNGDTQPTDDSRHDAAQKTRTDEDMSLLRQYHFVFYISLRHATGLCDLETMIKENILMKDDDLADVLSDILKTDSERCLVILDGLDEWTAPDGNGTNIPCVSPGLPKRNIMHNWTIITTSRPWKLELIRPESTEMDQLIKLSGIGDISAEKCIDAVVEFLNTRRGKEKLASECREHLKSKQLRQFMTLPLLLRQLVCIWFDDGDIGNSQCDIYGGMIDVYLRYSSQHFSDVPFDLHGNSKNVPNLPNCLKKREHCVKFKQHLFKLCRQAFDMLFSEARESSLCISRAAMHLSENEIDMWLNVGLLSQDIIDEKCAMEQRQLFFPHKSIQEFLAAVYISMYNDQIALDKIKGFCKSVRTVMEMSQLFHFVAGMGPAKFTEISAHIAQTVSKIREIQLYRPLNHNVRYMHAVGQMQTLMSECIEEMHSNGHTDCSVYLQDLILIASENNTRLNKACKSDIISLHVSKLKSDPLPRFWQTDYDNRELPYSIDVENELPCKRLSNLQMLILTDVCFPPFSKVLKSIENSLQAISLYYTKMYDLTGGKMDSFVQCQSLQVICLHEIHLRCHQMKELVSSTALVLSLKHLQLSSVRCSLCCEECENCKDYQLDLTPNSQLHTVKVINVTVEPRQVVAPRLHTIVSKDLFRSDAESEYENSKCTTCQLDLSRWMNMNIVCIENPEMISFVLGTSTTHRPLENSKVFTLCFNMSVTTRIAIGSNLPFGPVLDFEDPYTNQQLSGVVIRDVVLKHDQLLTLMSFLGQATSLSVIELCRLHCDEHDLTCKCHLDLSKHTSLKKLEIDSMPVTTLHVNTQRSKIHNPNYDVVLNNLQRVDDLDISTETLTMGNIYSSKVQLSSNCRDRRITNIETVQEAESHVDESDGFKKLEVKMSQEIGSTEINIVGVKSELSWKLVGFILQFFNGISLCGLKCAAHDPLCECQFNLGKQTSLNRLHIEKMRITKFYSYESSLVRTCSTFSLNNVTLHGKEFQEIMSFLEQTTCLNKITLRKIKCIDHEQVYKCQLDLRHHPSLGRLEIDDLNVPSLHIITHRSETQFQDSSIEVSNLCANVINITNDQLKLVQIHCDNLYLNIPSQDSNSTQVQTVELSDVNLKHEAFHGVMPYLNQNTRLQKITLFKVKCIDHEKQCGYQLDFRNHSSLQWLKIDSVRVTSLHVITERSDTTGMRDSVPCHRVEISIFQANKISITTDELKLARVHCDRFLLNIPRHGSGAIDSATSAVCKHNLISLEDRYSLTIKEIEFSEVSLKHEAFHGVMLYLKQNTRLQEITLFEVKCIDHGKQCGYQLDFRNHSSLQWLKIDSVHVTSLHVITERSDTTGMRDSVPCHRVEISIFQANKISITTDELKLARVHCDRFLLNIPRHGSGAIDSATSAVCKHNLISLEDRYSLTIKEIEFSEVSLKHEAFHGVMLYLKQNTRLQEITLFEVKCIDHGKQCGYQLDFRNHSSLQWLKIDSVHVTSLHVITERSDTTGMRDSVPCHRVEISIFQANKISITTDELKLARVHCDRFLLNIPRHGSGAIDSATSAVCKHNLISLEDRYSLTIKEIEFSEVSLKHEAFHGVMLYLKQNTRLQEITLFKVKCIDHGKQCGYQLDFQNHSSLRWLKIDSIHVTRLHVIGPVPCYRMEISNLQADEMNITTDNLTLAHIHCDRLRLNTPWQRSAIIYRATSAACKPNRIRLNVNRFINIKVEFSDVSLKHGAFQDMMSCILLEEQNCFLIEINMSEMKCIDHGNQCDWQLDLKHYRPFKRLQIRNLHVTSLHVITQRSETRLDSSVEIPNLQASEMNIATQQLKLVHIHSDKLHIDISKEGCGVIDETIPARYELSSREPDLLSFQNRYSIEIKKVEIIDVSLKHDALLLVMSFLEQSTCLKEITLSEIKCIDHGKQCAWQLDLQNQSSLQRLKIDSLHVTRLHVITQRSNTGRNSNVEVSNLSAKEMNITTYQLKLSNIVCDELQLNIPKEESGAIGGSISAGYEPNSGECELLSLENRYRIQFEIENVSLKRDTFHKVISFLERCTCGEKKNSE